MGFLKVIFNDLKEPKKQDPAFNSWIEIFFNYPGVWALVNHRFAHFFYTKNFKTLARIIAGISKILTNVDINPGAKIGNNVFMDHAFGIVIGETVIIGDNVLLYQGVTLGGVSLNKGKRHPTLENNVVIGAGAKVLGNITIGENSKVGANSVVVKNVPKNSTAVGIPAKIVSKESEPALSHDKIPDIEGKIFEYILKRLSIIEKAISSEEIAKSEKSLDEENKEYLKSIDYII